MNITQTRYFKEDAEHWTKLAKEYMYTTAKEETRLAILKLDRVRGKDYTDKLMAKCNQKLKTKFYYRD